MSEARKVDMEAVWKALEALGPLCGKSLSQEYAALANSESPTLRLIAKNKPAAKVYDLAERRKSRDMGQGIA